MRLHTRLIELLLIVACFVLPCIVQYEQFNQRPWSRRFMFSPSQELYRDHIFVCTFCTYWCLCVYILVYPFFPSCLLLLVYLVYVRHIVYTLPLVVFGSVYLRSSNHDWCLHTQRDFIQDWLNYYLSLPTLSWPFIVHHEQSNERSWSRMFSRTLSQPHCCLCILHILMFVRLHTFLSIFPLVLVVVGLLGMCSVYCVHIASCCLCFRCVFVIYLFHTHRLSFL